MTSRYHIVKSFKEVKQLVKACKVTKYASFDFETNAVSIYQDGFTPTVLSVSFQVGSGIIIPLNHFDSPFRDKKLGGNGKWKSLLIYFGRQVIEDIHITKVAWNWKFDNQIMMKYGIRHKGRALDGMLAKYLLDEERPMDLKSMVKRYLTQFSGYEDYVGSKLAWDKKPLEGLSKYSAQDSDLTLRLTLFFEKKLIDLGFYSLYRNLIMMASRVLQDAEANGMKLDIEFNESLKIKYVGLIEKSQENLRSIPTVMKFEKFLIKDRKQSYIDKIQEEIDIIMDDTKAKNKIKLIEAREAKIAKITIGSFTTKKERDLIEPINFGSPKVMTQLLYSHRKGYKFPVLKYTDKGEPSTGEDAILDLKQYDKDGFINKLIELRGLQTTYSTFVLGIGEKIGSDGKIHPTFNIHGTVTGRMSCTSGETLVCTDLGDIPIMDLCPKEVGEKIITEPINALTHTSRYQSITKGINKGSEMMYKVTLEDGSSIKVTLNHIFITNHGEVKLKDIYKNFQNGTICKYKLLKLSHE